MGSPYICGSCRSSMLRYVRKTPLQFPARGAGFVSLNQPRPAPSADSTQEPQTTIAPLPSATLPSVDGASNPRQGDFRRTRHDRSNQSSMSQQALQGLFEATVKASEETSEITPPSAETLKRIELLRELRRMVDNMKVPVAKSWRFFIENLGPEVWGGQQWQPTIYLPTVRKLFWRISIARKNTPLDQTIPRFQEVVVPCSSLGLLQISDWFEYTWALLNQVAAIGKAVRATKGGDEDLVRLQREVVHDVVVAWKYLERLAGSPVTSSTQSASEEEKRMQAWFQLPPNFRQSYRKAPGVPLFTSTIFSLFPRFPRTLKARKSFSQIVLATFGLLHDLPDVRGVDAHRRQLLVFLSQAVRCVDEVELDHILGEEVHPLLNDSVTVPWATLIQAAQEMRLAADPSKTSTPGISSSSALNKGVSVANSALRRRLQIAFQKKDVAQATRLFETLQQLDKADITSGLCNYFLEVYMSLRQVGPAIEVWNYMTRVGLEPTLVSWTSMLQGCKVARDSTLSESIWQKMIESSVKPDVVCWTSRIHILAECGQPDTATAALDEMAQRWLSTARAKYPKATEEELMKYEDIDGVVKPTIQSVNAAILGFLRRRQTDQAFAVVGWAEKLGIQPDLVTYNTLLRPLVRSGRMEDAVKLLHVMSERKVTPDIVTFTTILDETFRNAEELSPEEQQATLSFVFDEMENVGLRANLHTYGKIIHACLQSRSRDMSAVNSVLSRMTAQRLVPSTYIYTILMSHYFEQEPANIPAIKTLFDHIEMTGAELDNVFWDRVIEGYCNIGDMDNALRIFRKVDKETSRVGWFTLRQLLSTLREYGQTDAMRELIRTVLRTRGEPVLEIATGKAGQAAFWKYAAEIHLI